MKVFEAHRELLHFGEESFFGGSKFMGMRNLPDAA
jgi:hypothetical protein